MTILLSRSLGGVTLDVVISERHKAEMEIAEHPVERGAKISDHAWRKPYSVELESIVAAPNAMSAYEALLAVQKSAEPFDLVTGLRIYENMLIKEMSATRDKEKSRILFFTASCQEVIIVSTESGSAPTSAAGGSTGDSTLNASSSRVSAAQSTTARGQVQARSVTPSPAAPGFNPSDRLFSPPGSLI